MHCLVRSQLPSFVKLCVNDDFPLWFLTRFRETYCTHAAWGYGGFSCQFSLLRIRTVDWSMNYQLVLQSLSWLTETGWIRSYSRVNVLRNITCPQTLPEHRTLTWHVNERVFTGTTAFLWFFRSLPSVSCKVSRRVFLFIGSKGSFFGNFSLDYKVVIEKRSRKTNESSCGTENYRTKLTLDTPRSCTWICELENKL